MTCFAALGKFPVAAGRTPATVDTVINHAVVNKTQILAVISGGVYGRAGSFCAAFSSCKPIARALSAVHSAEGHRAVPRSAWWWD